MIVTIPGLPTNWCLPPLAHMAHRTSGVLTHGTTMRQFAPDAALQIVTQNFSRGREGGCLEKLAWKLTSSRARSDPPSRLTGTMEWVAGIAGDEHSLAGPSVDGSVGQMGLYRAGRLVRD